MIQRVNSCSETGLKRQVNQDAVSAFYKEYSGLFLVADGMGGHYKGEIASGMASEILGTWWCGMEKYIEALPFPDAVSSLEKCVQKANRDILRIYQNLGRRGGTTLCVLLICKNAYAVLHVGDSRIYCCRSGLFERMTADDVWENQKQIRCMAEEEELKKSSHYGRLTQALGFSEQIMLHTRTGQAEGKCCFFLCSDGIYKYCPEKILKKNIMRTCLTGNVDKAMGRIKETVYQNGAGDNLSMIMVRMKETADGNH